MIGLKKVLAALSLAAFVVSMAPMPADAAASVTRIKDIAKVQGVRSNQLVGYGLVVGLAGTGDSNKALETVQSIGNMLKAFGVSINPSSLKPDNVAAVMVTATLPPFSREGDTIDVTVSSLGDADSIQGGTLIQTPLRAGNGEVYAVAQGPVSTGGFIVGNSGSKAQKNFPTVGTTPNGAIVEKSVEDDLGQDGTLGCKSLLFSHDKIPPSISDICLLFFEWKYRVAQQTGGAWLFFSFTGVPPFEKWQQKKRCAGYPNTAPLQLHFPGIYPLPPS